jgi:hypothetical protein
MAALAAVAIAAEQPKPNPDADELVRRLDDPRFAVREAAAKAIEALGPEALPALRRAKDHPDLQTRARIAKWIPQFEAEAVVAPRLVTLHLKQKSLPDVMAALRKASGYKVHLDGKLKEVAGRFDFDFDNVPFWTALDGICSRCGLTADFDDEIVVSVDNVHNPHIDHHGAFRIIVNELDHTLMRRLTLTPSPINRHFGRKKSVTTANTDQMRVGLTIEAEPGLTILDGGLAGITVARDDQDHSMLSTGREDADEIERGALRRTHGFAALAQSSCSFYAALQGPSSRATAIKELKGVIALTIGREHKVHVLSDQPLSAKGVKFTCSRGTIEIINTHNSPDGFEVTYAVPLKVGFGRHWLKLQVLDANGLPFESHNGQGTANGERMEMTETFTPPTLNLPAPAKLTCTWWETVEYHVRFEFHDVPLP